MAQILVRDLSEKTVNYLKKKAKEDGRSLQSEVKAILEQAAQMDMTASLYQVDRFRARFKGKQLPDSAVLIREERSR